MLAIAVRHVAFEGLGSLRLMLTQAGFVVEEHEASQVDQQLLESADLLVLLGGPLSANDDHRFTYLSREVAAVRQRIQRAKPTLGICLGAQLIARAMEFPVVVARRKEIEWLTLSITQHGALSPLQHLKSPVLHWHGETFELPGDVASLASTPDCPNQAFAIGQHTLALQFHIEVRADDLEAWYAGHIHELDTQGIDIERLRDEGQRWSAACEAQCQAALKPWLAGAFRP